MCTIQTNDSLKLCGTLLTDLNMNRSATAQAVSNLVRCLSVGGAVAILQPMVENVGPAGCFTIYASIPHLPRHTPGLVIAAIWHMWPGEGAADFLRRALANKISKCINIMRSVN